MDPLRRGLVDALVCGMTTMPGLVSTWWSPFSAMGLRRRSNSRWWRFPRLEASDRAACGALRFAELPVLRGCVPRCPRRLPARAFRLSAQRRESPGADRTGTDSDRGRPSIAVRGYALHGQLRRYLVRGLRTLPAPVLTAADSYSLPVYTRGCGERSLTVAARIGGA